MKGLKAFKDIHYPSSSDDIRNDLDWKIKGLKLERLINSIMFIEIKL